MEATVFKYFSQHAFVEYINNSHHLARKYARIFVRGHYLFREANSFARAKLEEDCELRRTDNVQGQISKHIFKAKWRLLCLLSFKYFSFGSPVLVTVVVSTSIAVITSVLRELVVVITLVCLR